jgi:hypothetical protein
MSIYDYQPFATTTHLLVDRERAADDKFIAA